MAEDKLFHLIYASVATSALDQSQLLSLLTTARNNNSKKNITGILLYSDQSFFQILEGQSNNIEDLFMKINADPRHHDVKCIINEPIEKRDFADWTMGFAAITQRQLAEIPGLNDFFVATHHLGYLDKGHAQHLMQAFTHGYWRKALK